jgi:hypothetical protein
MQAVQVHPQRFGCLLVQLDRQAVSEPGEVQAKRLAARADLYKPAALSSRPSQERSRLVMGKRQYGSCHPRTDTCRGPEPTSELSDPRIRLPA